MLKSLKKKEQRNIFSNRTPKKNVKNRHPQRKILVTYDRGYNSFELMFKHLELNVDFLIRIDDSTLHKEIEQLNSDDEILRLYLNNKRTKLIKDKNLRKKIRKRKIH